MTRALAPVAYGLVGTILMRLRLRRQSLTLLVTSHGHDLARRARASYVTTVGEVAGRACPEHTSSLQTKNNPVRPGIGGLCASSDVICAVFGEGVK